MQGYDIIFRITIVNTQRETKQKTEGKKGSRHYNVYRGTCIIIIYIDFFFVMVLLFECWNVWIVDLYTPYIAKQHCDHINDCFALFNKAIKYDSTYFILFFLYRLITLETKRIHAKTRFRRVCAERETSFKINITSSKNAK